MSKGFFYLLLFLQHNLSSVEFVLFTQPKSGTHLLIPILNSLTKKNEYCAREYSKNVKPNTQSFEEASKNPDNFLFALYDAPWTRQVIDEVWMVNQLRKAYLHLHAPYSPAMEAYLKKRNCINFFIKRDPRDQIVSLLNHYKHINFNDKEVELIESDSDRLLYMIKKESKGGTIHFMNWLNSPVCCILEFEKLMGSHGGKATDADAIGEIKKIAAALQLKIADSELEKLYHSHFGHGWNFFKGKVGVWKEYFEEKHKIAIKEEIGDLLIKLGYEKDLEW